jgi:hypothetical protein
LRLRRDILRHNLPGCAPVCSVGISRTSAARGFA